MTLRQTIQSAITTQGITHAELCRRIGYPHSGLCAWLAGRRGLRCDTLERMMSVLGLSLGVDPGAFTANGESQVKNMKLTE